MRDLATAVSEAAGLRGKTRSLSAAELEALLPPFMGHLIKGNMRVSAAKAKRLLGWQPQRATVLEDLTRGSYHKAL